MQIRLLTSSSAQDYIVNRAWRNTCLPVCPLHPSGGCSLARHGSYGRKTPDGLRIARWYCPEGHRTFSLLPDFLSCRLPGLLVSIETAVITARIAKNLEQAADALRGFDVSLPSALRWLRRRTWAVQRALDAVFQLTARVHATFFDNGLSLSDEPGQAHLLLELRRSLPPELLHQVPAPLGFLQLTRPKWPHDSNQHDMGPDESRDIRYGLTAYLGYSSCTRNPTNSRLRGSLRRPRTC